MSLDKTLPDGLLPAVPFAIPPASVAVAESDIALGPSLTAVTVMLALSVAVLNAVVPPLVEVSTFVPAVPLV